MRKVYKSEYNRCKKEHDRSCINKLETLKSNNPKEFWRLYNELIGSHSGDDGTSANPIPPEDWINHFDNLLNSPLNVDSSQLNNIKSVIDNPPDDLIKSFNELNL